MERTPWKLPILTYTMEVTSWNLQHGSNRIEPTSWKLPNGTYTMEVLHRTFIVTSWNVPWKLPHGMYSIEVT